MHQHFIVKTHREGFSLLELSIVLAIIGLLVGGILGGQSLLRSAALRATITQITEIQFATNSFRTQYGAYPGDLPNAQSYWGTSVANGDGDGIVEAAGCPSGHESDPDCANYDGERAQYFLQLSKAELVSTYDSSTTLGRGYPAIKSNPTTGMIVTGSWAVSPSSSNNVGIESYALAPIYLYLGVCAPASLGTSSLYNDCGIFKPEDAWNMDKKLDDGMPVVGKFMSEAYTATCATGTGPTATYAMTVQEPNCNSMFALK